jgi:hypothetical protein
MTVDLDAIRARLAAATPGPWAPSPGGIYGAVVNPVGVTACGCDPHPGTGRTCTEAYGGQLVAESMCRADIDLVANAPTDLAALCDEVERLRGICHARGERLLEARHKVQQTDDADMPVVHLGVPITVVAAKKPGQWIARGIRCFATADVVRSDVEAVVGRLDDEIEWSTCTYHLPHYLVYGSGDLPEIGWPNGVWLFEHAGNDRYVKARRVGDSLGGPGSVNGPWGRPSATGGV